MNVEAYSPFVSIGSEHRVEGGAITNKYDKLVNLFCGNF